jgi:hypothetical protein
MLYQQKLQLRLNLSQLSLQRMDVVLNLCHLAGQAQLMTYQVVQDCLVCGVRAAVTHLEVPTRATQCKCRLPEIQYRNCKKKTVDTSVNDPAQSDVKMQRNHGQLECHDAACKEKLGCRN